MSTMVVELKNGDTTAYFDGFTVCSCEPGPSAFQLFLTSLVSCAAYTAEAYCERKGLPVDGLKIHATAERDEKTRLATKIIYEYEFPADFPEKEKTLVIRAANTCFVKKHLYSPPEFESVIRQ